jgi:hypothetical protein
MGGVGGRILPILIIQGLPIKLFKHIKVETFLAMEPISNLSKMSSIAKLHKHVNQSEYL